MVVLDPVPMKIKIADLQFKTVFVERNDIDFDSKMEDSSFFGISLHKKVGLKQLGVVTITRIEESLIEAEVLLLISSVRK